MAPTLCSRCGDAIEEDCDPRDELAELEDLLDRLTRKRYDLKRKVNHIRKMSTWSLDVFGVFGKI